MRSFFKIFLMTIAVFIYYRSPMANEPFKVEQSEKDQTLRGSTFHFPEEELVPGEDAPNYTPPAHLQKPEMARPFQMNAPLYESSDLDFYIPPRSHVALQFDHQSKSLNMLYPDYENLLSDVAVAAIEKAPKWMQNDLKNIFSLLGPKFQDKWASAILDAEDPYIDEIAFCIAHLSPQYLMSSYAYVQLLVDNARLIYENDKYLDYVQVIDYGSSQTDPNYYSTTRYRKAKYLDTLDVEVPKDIYYWYIVHPKISDEIPAYIDPDIIEDNLTHNNNITTPENGYFWRDFVFNHNDLGYAKLKDLLKGCKVLRNEFDAPAGAHAHAMQILNQWKDGSMEFTSNEERPHQPVRIYRKHIGRCGEDGDMRAAIARAALIPAANVASYSTDHVWNEFWDERWIHWDGTIDDPYMYLGGSWNKKFGTVFRWRSDGCLISVTSRYTTENSTLHIYALDSLKQPIDGARVVLYTTGLDGTLWFDTYGCTDSEGKVTFIVGTDRSYYAKMSCDYGTVPATSGTLARVISKSVDGEIYSVSLSIKAEKPIRVWQEIQAPKMQNASHYLKLDFKVPSQIVRGTDMYDDMEVDAYQFIEKAGGRANFVMMDEADYYKFVKGETSAGFYSSQSTDSMSTGCELDDSSDWYFVFDNSNSLHTLQHIVGSANLYSASDPSIPSVYILQNYPNPVNPATSHTTISFQLPQKSNMELSIYNVLGQKIKTLLKETRYAGSYSTTWDGRDKNGQVVPSGIYFCKIQTEIGESSQKMLVVR
jgi:hypothetical protein